MECKRTDYILRIQIRIYKDAGNFLHLFLVSAYHIAICLSGVFMSCSEIIQSDDVYDLIISSDERNTPIVEPICEQTIGGNFAVLYYDRSTVPALSISRYSYTSIPKLFSLMDRTNLDVSGILSVQNQPGLSLKGQGVLIGIVDTGIDYDEVEILSIRCFISIL